MNSKYNEVCVVKNYALPLSVIQKLEKESKKQNKSKTEIIANLIKNMG